MSKNPLKFNEDNLQPSILGFVDKPNYSSSTNRLPRPLKRSELHPIRGSSSSSNSRKRKISAVDQTDNNLNTGKVLIMEPKHENSAVPEEGITPVPTPSTNVNNATPEDNFTKALKEMEDRLTTSLMKKMKEMIDPLQNSINSLVLNQKDWDQQKADVKNIQVENMKITQKMQLLSDKNTQLESQVKHLETKLLENNIIMHGVKECKWELDST